jgi:hypothetical protein
MMDKLLTTLQSRLVKLEASELDEITKKSQDEAIKVALLLANQPAPPMPEFELDPKYKNAEGEIPKHSLNEHTLLLQYASTPFPLRKYFIC